MFKTTAIWLYHNFVGQWFSEMSLYLGSKGFKRGGIPLEARVIWRVPETSLPAWHLDGDGRKLVPAESSPSPWSHGDSPHSPLTGQSHSPRTTQRSEAPR